MADVVGGIGPFLATYLQAERHWTPDKVGIALSAAGLATVIAHTPAGILIDGVRHKRALVAGGCILVTLASLAILGLHSLAAVTACQVVMGTAGAFLGPAVAAITLGLVGNARMGGQVGRNEMFNHAGNVATAALGGFLGYALSQAWIFYLVAVMCAVTVFFLYRIRGEEIDFDRARGGPAPPVFSAKLLADRRLGAVGIAFFLFHFANGAMLPLVGQRLAAGSPRLAPLFMGGEIFIAQCVMVPTAWATGRVIGTRGRKIVLLVAWAVEPSFLLAIQILDGVGAGVFGVVWVVIVADLTQGTGRFNAAQGFVGMLWGFGAALSPLLGGTMAKTSGYPGAFLTLAGIALLALVFLIFFVPETGKRLLRTA